MKRTKSQRPEDRIGIYEHFDEIPQRHRLAQYCDQYRGRDVWQEFCLEHEFGPDDSDHFRRSVNRVGRSWSDHMNEQGRHVALASPSHVERWCQYLLDDKSRATAYNYWFRIKRFYEWLTWHTDHPHRYSPVMLAVVAGGASREIWNVKIEKWDRSREQYASEGEQ